eukprot:scaffold54_cov158-Amphora_coffeaeformis.AAC.9
MFGFDAYVCTQSRYSRKSFRRWREGVVYFGVYRKEVILVEVESSKERGVDSRWMGSVVSSSIIATASSSGTKKFEMLGGDASTWRSRLAL